MKSIWSLFSFCQRKHFTVINVTLLSHTAPTNFLLAHFECCKFSITHWSCIFSNFCEPLFSLYSIKSHKRLYTLLYIYNAALSYCTIKNFVVSFEMFKFHWFHITQWSNKLSNFQELSFFSKSTVNSFMLPCYLLQHHKNLIISSQMFQISLVSYYTEIKQIIKFSRATVFFG